MLFLNISCKTGVGNEANGVFPKKSWTYVELRDLCEFRESDKSLWYEFKDPVSYMYLADAVAASWSLTQEVAGLNPFNDKYIRWMNFRNGVFKKSLDFLRIVPQIPCILVVSWKCKFAVNQQLNGVFFGGGTALVSGHSCFLCWRFVLLKLSSLHAKNLPLTSEQGIRHALTPVLACDGGNLQSKKLPHSGCVMMHLPVKKHLKSEVN